MTAITTAELALYAILAVPVLFVLVKHGRPGLLGWLYLQAFCVLRIVGGGMALSNSPSAMIVGNIGLSPLLLAASGIFHEAFEYLNRERNAKVQLIMVLMFHMLVVGATALVAAGGSALQKAEPDASAAALLKAGMGVFLLAWVILAGSVVVAVARGGRKKAGRSVEVGLTLRNGVAIALVFIGIRIIYSFVAFVTGNPSINPITGNKAAIVILSLLPELIASITFLIVGFQTRHCLEITREVQGQSMMLGH